MKNLVKIKLFLLLLIFFINVKVFANVEQINIIGNNKIYKNTIAYYLDFKIKENLTKESINRTVQNLRSKGLFHQILIKDTAGTITIKIKENPVIRKIYIQGNKKLELNVIKKELKIRNNNVYSEFNLNNSIRKIEFIYRKIGYFASSVHLAIKEQNDNNVDVTFFIHEGKKPILKNINFYGNKKISKKKLLKVIKNKKYKKKRKKKKKVKRKKKKIARKQKKQKRKKNKKQRKKKRKKKKYIYKIRRKKKKQNKKQRKKYKKEKRKQEKRKQEKRKQKKKKKKKKRKFRKKYNPIKDKSLIAKYYTKKGYINFEVLSSIAKISPNGKSFFLTYNINEGDKFLFGKSLIICKINTIRATQLKKLIKYKNKKRANINLINKTLYRFFKFCKKSKSKFIKIDCVLNVNKKNKIIDIRYIITQPPKYLINNINIIGNKQTLDSVIRKKLRISEQKHFNLLKIKQSKKKIIKLKSIKSVTFKNTKSLQSNKINLDINIKEKNTKRGKISFRHKRKRKFKPTIMLSDSNFLKRGTIARLHIRKNVKKLQFIEPKFMNRNVAVGLKLRKFHKKKKKSKKKTKKNKVISLKLGHRITKRIYHNMGYFYSKRIIKRKSKKRIKRRGVRIKRKRRLSRPAQELIDSKSKNNTKIDNKNKKKKNKRNKNKKKKNEKKLTSSVNDVHALIKNKKNKKKKNKKKLTSSVKIKKKICNDSIYVLHYTNYVKPYKPTIFIKTRCRRNDVDILTKKNIAVFSTLRKYNTRKLKVKTHGIKSSRNNVHVFINKAKNKRNKNKRNKNKRKKNKKKIRSIVNNVHALIKKKKNKRKRNKRSKNKRNKNKKKKNKKKITSSANNDYSLIKKNKNKRKRNKRKKNKRKRNKKKRKISLFFKNQKYSKRRIKSSISHSIIYKKINSEKKNKNKYKIKFSQSLINVKKKNPNIKNKNKKKYIRRKLRAYYLQQFFKGRVILKLKGRMGNISNFTDNNASSKKNRFFIGRRHVRGFKKRGIGPRMVKYIHNTNKSPVGGYKFFTNTTQIKFILKLLKNFSIKCIFFHDAGSLYGSNTIKRKHQHKIKRICYSGTIDPKISFRPLCKGGGINRAYLNDSKKIRSSYGAGLEINSPIGKIYFSHSRLFKKLSFDRASNKKIRLLFVKKKNKKNGAKKIQKFKIKKKMIKNY